MTDRSHFPFQQLMKLVPLSIAELRDCIVVHTDVRRETGLAGGVPIQIRGQIANERQRWIVSRLERFGYVGDGHRGTADGGGRGWLAIDAQRHGDGQNGH